MNGNSNQKEWLLNIVNIFHVYCFAPSGMYYYKGLVRWSSRKKLYTEPVSTSSSFSREFVCFIEKPRN